MKSKARRKIVTTSACLAVAVLWFFGALLLPGEASAAEGLSVDFSMGNFSVIVELPPGQLAAIEVMGPQGSLVAKEDLVGGTFAWAPQGGEPDGLYKYEMQVVDGETHAMVAREAGSFKVMDGGILAPQQSEPLEQNNLQSMFRETGTLIARAVNGLMEFLVPSAEAADLIAEDTSPEIRFDDSQDEDCTSIWDWRILTEGGTSNTDGNNWFSIRGVGETETGNCASDVEIMRINHNGATGANSPQNSLVIDTNGDLRFANNGMFFDRSAGFLGIGLTTPSYPVDVVNGMPVLRLRASIAADSKQLRIYGGPNYPELSFFNQDLLLSPGTAGRRVHVHGSGSTASQLHFSPTWSNTAGGFLTSAAENNFYISSGSMWDGTGWVQRSTDGQSVIIGSGVAGLRMFTRTGCPVGSACFNTERLRLDYDGYVAFGGFDPAYPIHMASGARCTVGGVWTNASSRKYKDEIKELSSDDAVKTLMNLTPVTFTYKTDSTDKHVGFIAEDVPDLVATPDREGLSPMDITAVMAKVVKEQQSTIDKQQIAMEKQQQTIEDLLLRLENLEKISH